MDKKSQKNNEKNLIEVSIEATKEVIDVSIEATKKTVSDPEKLLYGSLLSFTTFLILPILILLGYYVRTTRECKYESEEIPSFKNLLTLAGSGLFIILVTIVLYLAPFLLMLVYFVVLGGLSELSAAIGIVGILVAFILLMLLMFIPPYIILAVIASYAHEKKMSSVFKMSNIRPVIFSIDYLIAMLIVLLIIPIIVGAIISVLSITIIGSILIPTVFFIQLTVQATVVGHVYRRKNREVTRNSYKNN